MFGDELTGGEIEDRARVRAEVANADTHADAIDVVLGYQYKATAAATAAAAHSGEYGGYLSHFSVKIADLKGLWGRAKAWEQRLEWAREALIARVGSANNDQ